MLLECHMGIPERVRRKLSAKILFVNLDGKGQHIGDSRLINGKETNDCTLRAIAQLRTMIIK